MEAICSVLIPTYNRHDTILRCLDHLAAQTVGADTLQVIVVDDGSSDGTVTTLRSRFWPFAELIVHRQANAGPAAARARGLMDATAPVTLFINDDALVAPDAIQAHLRVHGEHPDSMVLGTFDFAPAVADTPVSRILTQTSHLFAYPLLTDGDTAAADLGATCNLSVPTIGAVGAGFDQRFTFAAEDVDFALRLQNAGYTLRFCASARAHHDHRLTVDAIERMARLRGVGAARLSLKHGVPDKLLSDLRVVMTDIEGAEQAFARAGQLLRAELRDDVTVEHFSEDCYGALDTVFRVGNLLGCLDEPALVRRAMSLAPKTG